jgi:hypothetical protein
MNMSQNWRPERVSRIGQELELEWYAGGSIVVYVLLDMLPEVLQTWSQVALDVLNDWPAGKPYLALYDLSHRGVVINYLNLVQRKMFSLGITQEGEEHALASIAQREDFSARVALYTSMRHSGHVGRLFATIDARKTRPDLAVQYDAFYEREAAFEWLDKMQSQ